MKKHAEKNTIFYGHYRSIFNHCNIIGLQSYRIR